MDATELGLQFFYIILIPGFFFTVGFKFTAGIQGKGADFGTMCIAGVMGVLLLIFTQNDPEKLEMITSNPLGGGVALAFVGLLVGAVLGIPVGWIRSRMW